MAELTTDQLYEKITTIALDKEKMRYEQILRQANAAIGLGGTCVKVYIKPSQDENGTYVISSDYIYELVKSLLSNRKQKIEADAVNDFLKSVETFKQHMSALEQYSLENLE